MKKLFSILFVCVVAATFSFISCGGGDEGGAGADFDATQYYTKTEVDGLVTGVVTNSSATADTITGNDFAGRTSTGWAAPAGAKAAIMELSITNSDSGSADLTTYIEVSVSDETAASMGTSMTVPADGTYYSKIFYVPVSGGKTIVAYHPYSSGHFGITDLTTIDNFEISVKPVAWLK